MDERYWFLTVGPLDVEGAYEIRERLAAQLDESLNLDLLDNRLEYVRASPVGAVENVIPIIESALASGTLSDDARLTALAYLSDMRSWIEDEYAPSLDAEEVAAQLDEADENSPGQP